MLLRIESGTNIHSDRKEKELNQEKIITEKKKKKMKTNCYFCREGLNGYTEG